MDYLRKVFEAFLLTYIIVILISVPANSVFAHMPLGIEAYKDIENKQIIVVIKHHTRKPYFLYIVKVEIVIDNQEPIVRTFRRQKRKIFPPIVLDVPQLDSARKIRIWASPRRGKDIEAEFMIDQLEEYKTRKTIIPEYHNKR